MNYEFMDQYQGTFRVSAMSRVVRVSRSGFYEWRQRQGDPLDRPSHRAQVDEAEKKAFEAAKGRSGSPRLTPDLADAGHRHDRKTIASSMRRQGLRAKAAKKFKVTTNSKHNLPVAPNLLQRQFTAKPPNQKYVGDITYRQRLCQKFISFHQSGDYPRRAICKLGGDATSSIRVH